MNKLELTMPNAQYGYGKSCASVLLRHICGKQSLVLHFNICSKNPPIANLKNIRCKFLQKKYTAIN